MAVERLIQTELFLRHSTKQRLYNSASSFSLARTFMCRSKLPPSVITMIANRDTVTPITSVNANLPESFLAGADCIAGTA